jgi:hypothetical protein
VTPKHDFVSPLTMPGSMRRFCSSVPNTTTGSGPNMLMWMLEAPLMQAPDSSTVCMTIVASVTPRPAPPYSSGIAVPSQPASPMAL